MAEFVSAYRKNENIYVSWQSQEGEAVSEQPLDRELLRRAGEHIGTLAERTHERYVLMYTRDITRNKEYERYARLSRLSREVLEIANG